MISPFMERPSWGVSPSMQDPQDPCPSSDGADSFAALLAERDELLMVPLERHRAGFYGQDGHGGYPPMANAGIFPGCLGFSIDFP